MTFIEEGEHSYVSSAKTSGIILGILIPLAIIAFCIFTVCRRARQNETTRYDPKAKGGGGHIIRLSSPSRTAGNSGQKSDQPLMTIHKAIEHESDKVPREEATNVQQGRGGALASPVIPTLAESPKSPRTKELAAQPTKPIYSSEDGVSTIPSSEVDSPLTSPAKKASPAKVGTQGLVNPSLPPVRSPLVYDAVYFTREPLPNRPDVKFSEELRDQEEYPPPPPPSMKDKLAGSPVHSVQSSSEQEQSESASSMPTPPPPPPPSTLRPSRSPYISASLNV